MFRKYLFVCAAVLFAAISAAAASPFTADPSAPVPAVPKDLAPAIREINRILEKSRCADKLPMIPRASDAVFVRRAYLAIVGRIPKLSETRDFLNSKDPAKHTKLIDRLLADEEHADLIAMRFADMLRIKSEFPVNLWPNAVQAFHHRIRTDIFNNRPYSEMVFEMLTSSGSNFRVPYANFFRGSGDRTPKGLAKITALTFMGLRTENLPEEKLKKFEALFSRIRFKSSSEWKEEFVFTDPEPAELKVWIPGVGSRTIESPAEEPRLVLARALVSDDNPYFARAFVNRAWSWFFGKGLIDPADDITPERGSWDRFLCGIGLDSPSEREIHPELLDLLTREFRRSGYDMRTLFRLILNCRAFHTASVLAPRRNITGEEEKPEAVRARTERLFLTFPVRRIEAEVISDSIGTLFRSYNKYSSVIPEPFTYLPGGTHAVQIADGSISSGMLDLFGRPSRDTGKISERNNNATAAQRLYLLNSNVIYRQISNLANRTGRSFRGTLRKNSIEYIYLTVLSRKQTPIEQKWIMDYWQKLPKKQRWQIWTDLYWSLINSKEFLYYH